MVLRDFLAPFYEACPNSVLEFQQVDHDLFAKLEDGRVDAAILPDTRPIPPKYHALNLYALHYNLCVREDHPLALYYREHGSVPVSEISKYRKVVVSNQLSSEAKVFSLDETNIDGTVHQKVGLAAPYFGVIPTVLTKTNLTALLPDETADILRNYFGAKIAILPYGDLSEAFSYNTRLIWHERLLQHAPYLARTHASRSRHAMVPRSFCGLRQHASLDTRFKFEQLSCVSPTILVVK